MKPPPGKVLKSSEAFLKVIMDSLVVEPNLGNLGLHTIATSPCET